MSATVEGAGVELAYEERGSGAVVLLVHGIAADRAEWRPVVDELAGEARVVTYDRRGYGRSGAPEPYGGTSIEEQAEDAAALVRALGDAPVILCGADLGAIVCLDLVKRHRPLVRGAVLVDPALFQFVPAATAVLAEERQLLEEALREGGPSEAVTQFLERSNASAGRVERIAPHYRAFFADYAALAGWPVSRGELRAMDVPMTVITEPSAPQHVRAAAEALAAHAPQCRLEHGGEVIAAIRSLL